MKNLLAVILAVTCLFAVSGYIHAQTEEPPEPVPTVESPQPPDFPDELPQTAEELQGYIRNWILFVAGLLATHIMNGVKQIKWLGKQQWFLKLVTELVSGITASVVAFIMGNVIMALGFLDQSGLWQVILFAWPAAVGIYHTKKLSKAGAAYASSLEVKSFTSG